MTNRRRCYLRRQDQSAQLEFADKGHPRYGTNITAPQTMIDHSRGDLLASWYWSFFSFSCFRE